MTEPQQQKLKLWEILIPKTDYSQFPFEDFSINHHNDWDNKVLAISGGLTIQREAIGLWVRGENNCIREKVIPVKIACADKDIRQIANFTKHHYKQDVVLYYELSNNVHFIY